MILVENNTFKTNSMVTTFEENKTIPCTEIFSSKHWEMRHGAMSIKGL